MKKFMLIAILLLAGCSDKSETTSRDQCSEVLSTNLKAPEHPYDILRCSVVRVIDGDTIVVKFYVWSDIILERTIRFEDIDTWETRGPGKEKGKAAKVFLENLLASGEVILHTKRKKGKYGRLLGTVYVKRKDGVVISVAQALQAKGYEKVEMSRLHKSRYKAVPYPAYP